MQNISSEEAGRVELRHVFEIEVDATPDDVWRALTDPDLTERYYFNCRLESTLQPSAPFIFRNALGVATEGTLPEIQPLRRLDMSVRYSFDPEACKEEPHRESWQIDPIGDRRCRVRLVCDDYPGDAASYRMAPKGLPPL